MLRVVAVFLFASAGNWVSDLWDNTAGTVASDIKSWVRHMLDSLTGWINDAFTWVHHALDDISSWAGDAFNAVYKWATDAWNGLYGWASSAIGNVVSWVQTLVGTVQRWAEAAFNDLSHWAADALGALGNAVDALGRWVVDNVFNPLETFVLWVWHEVVEPGLHWLEQAIGDVRQWALDAYHFIVGLLGQAWDFIEKVAKPLLAVVEKAFHWLVFFAEHPFTWWHDLFNDVLTRAPEAIAKGALRAVQTEGDEIERLVAGWFG